MVEPDVERRTVLPIYLTKLNFQEKMIQLTNVFMYKYCIKISRENIQGTIVASHNKYQFSNTMPLCQIICLSARAPLWKIARKKVNNSSTDKEAYQFQVACVSYLNLKKQGTQGENW